MMMLQKKINLTDLNWVNLLTTSNADSRVPKTTETGFFRLQSQVTNTILAFGVYMDGASEQPTPIATSGSAIGALALEGSNLTYYVSFSGLTSPANNAHFHGPATPTNSASVLIGLSAPSATSGIISGTTVLTADQMTNFINGLIYMNIHTVNNGAGEIRGQVVPLRTMAFMDGASEVPSIPTSGSAVGALTFLSSRLFYNITYTNLSSSATLAHIHGPAPPTGGAGVLVGFPSPSGTSGTMSGSLALTPQQLAFIVAGQTYLNIHTVNNGGGEIRSQIYPMQVGASLTGPAEVPPIVSAGTASALMNIVSNKLTYKVTFTNLTSNATAAHIHGPASPTVGGAGVLIGFSGVPSATSGTITGTATITPLQIMYIMSGQTYVNIHTVNNSGGEIRGQLYPGN
jgi:hypothetical protein